jgi:hypothetical protein
MIIRVFRPTIHAAVITPDEEHLLKQTWIGHYEVIETD